VPPPLPLPQGEEFGKIEVALAGQRQAEPCPTGKREIWKSSNNHLYYVSRQWEGVIFLKTDFIRDDYIGGVWERSCEVGIMYIEST